MSIKTKLRVMLKVKSIISVALLNNLKADPTNACRTVKILSNRLARRGKLNEFYIRQLEKAPRGACRCSNLAKQSLCIWLRTIAKGC